MDQPAILQSKTIDNRSASFLEDSAASLRPAPGRGSWRSAEGSAWRRGGGACWAAAAQVFGHAGHAWGEKCDG